MSCRSYGGRSLVAVIVGNFEEILQEHLLYIGKSSTKWPKRRNSSYKSLNLPRDLLVLALPASRALALYRENLEKVA